MDLEAEVARLKAEVAARDSDGLTLQAKDSEAAGVAAGHTAALAAAQASPPPMFARLAQHSAKYYKSSQTVLAMPYCGMACRPTL